ncbi:MAG TPA: dihydrodipicolinate synthase family protein [Verrucomicrobiae bacterium]|nr:dihydrodipicolinate synthase family protein [Verrucomicrobiae bacterium]
MTTDRSIAARRKEILRQLFPTGIPMLWCPALTHYDSQGAIDGARIAAHLEHISPHVKGLLIPGSTGDGWELTDQETRQLLEIALDQAQRLKLYLLIGALKPNAAAALRMIRDTVDWIKQRAGETDTNLSLSKARVCGFTVCPPRGEQLTQDKIRDDLELILKSGLPTALYQLPQVTQNEIGPELASDLAARFENFIFLKDTSGADRIALSGKDLAGVFVVRGMEGDYAQWLKAAGGLYDGFLLSTANCFAGELSQIIRDAAAGRSDAARETSARITGVVNEVFQAVVHVPTGNPFANANKAIDHCRAYGRNAQAAPLPRLHGGTSLPIEAIRAAVDSLDCHGFAPRNGYLA